MIQMRRSPWRLGSLVLMGILLLVSPAWAAITVSHKTATPTGTDGLSITSGSFTATSGRVLFVCVDTRRTATEPDTPVMSSSGLGSISWTTVGSVVFSGDNHRVTLFVGTGASGTGTVTATVTGTNHLTFGIIVDEWSGVDTSTPYIVTNVATNTAAASPGVTVSLPNSFADATNNAAIGCFGSSTTNAWTQGSGFSLTNQVSQVDENMSVGAEYKIGEDLSVDISGSSGAWGGVAAEVKIEPSVTETTFMRRRRSL